MSLEVRIGELWFQVRRHAIVRYQERVRPALDDAELLAELARVLPGATVVYECPLWCSPAASDGNWPDRWVMLGDAIVFPACGLALLTCLTRGEVGAQVRVQRQERRRDSVERASRRGTKKKHGKVARDARRSAQAAREAMVRTDDVS